MPSFSERITQAKQHPSSATATATAATAAAGPATSVITSPSSDARRERHREPQLYVWVVTINREVTGEASLWEFQRYLSAIDPTLRRTLENTLDISKAGKNLSTLRKIVADLLPRMLMTRQRIPHNGWRFAKNGSGKWFIDSPPPPSSSSSSSNGGSGAAGAANKVMGYGLAERDSVIALAFAQGYKQQVVNIGMDIVRIPDYSSSGDEAEAFIASLMHKLAPEELSQIVPALPVEKKLSRLCIMLAVKEAYLKALGQPHGFDLSRISVNINPGGRSTIAVDKQVVNGWEFRLFTADIGAPPPLPEAPRVVQERYQCATAIWRGWKDRTEVVFAERDRDEMTSWLQFLTVTALARSVGSGGARGDATPAS
ncbi:hypothetical protein BKA62DRAFT_621789 [Auriculariales sp. MPI-PUGE-AT-0066]|nr:hypothetical protein BKA62DRAFT_621789 [Auriculariales sp. MPI-PUGE-AT-0066]